MRQEAPHGLLVLDKPAGITSRAAVNAALRWFPRRTRLGHTGTLDPGATGVLVLCVGWATRLAEYVQSMEKVYRSTFLLGCRSSTDDADGELVPVQVAEPPSSPDVHAALGRFIGEIDQVPPSFSAAKVTGKRAYKLARAERKIALEPRRITIHQIALLHYEYPLLDLEVRCGRGTYIRALARDLGNVLYCGAIVQALRRTRVGVFTLDGALGLDADRAAVLAQLRPCEDAVQQLPRLDLPAPALEKLRHGLPVSDQPDMQAALGKEIAVFAPDGILAAIASMDGAGKLWPEKVLARPGES